MVDLARNSSRGTVPFDIPLVAVGAAPAELDSIAPFRRTVGPSEKRECPKTLGQNDDGTHDFSSAGQTWSRGGTKTDSFTVFLEPLGPDRNYLICLQTYSRYTPAEYETLRSGLVQRIDSLFRERQTRDSVPPGPNSSRPRPVFRRYIPLTEPEVKKLVTFFQNAKPANAIAPKGSLFSDADTSEVNRVKTLLGFQAPLNGRLDALNSLIGSSQPRACITQVQAYCGDTAIVRIRLQLISDSAKPTLQRLLDGVSSSDSIAGLTTALILPALETIRLLLVPVPGTLDRVAAGQLALTDSGVVADPAFSMLDSLWTTADVAPRLVNVAVTRRRLSLARALVAAVAARPLLRSRLGVEDGIDSTVTQLDDALDAVQALETNLRELSSANADRERRISAAVAQLTAFKQRPVPVLGSTVELVLETRARRYISAEVGVAYGTQIGEAAPYVGVTIFPLGVNRQVPQHFLGPLRTRVGLMIGLTASSVAEKDRREDLFGNSALLTGVTWRFFDVFRASAGAMWLRQLEAEELSGESDVRATFYTSVGFDLDVQAVMGGIGKILGGGK